MVDGQKQQVFRLSQPQQAGAQQRPLRQIEWLAGFVRHQPLCLGLPLGR